MSSKPHFGTLWVSFGVLVEHGPLITLPPHHYLSPRCQTIVILIITSSNVEKHKVFLWFRAQILKIHSFFNDYELKCWTNTKFFSDFELKYSKIQCLFNDYEFKYWKTQGFSRISSSNVEQMHSFVQRLRAQMLKKPKGFSWLRAHMLKRSVFFGNYELKCWKTQCFFNDYEFKYWKTPGFLMNSTNIKKYSGFSIMFITF